MYLITQLSRMCGTPISTIRYYEKYGLIKGIRKDSKTKKNKFYDDETLEKLELIEEGKALGFSLSELKELIKAWYNIRVTHAKRIELLNAQVAILKQKENKLKDVKMRLLLLVKEIEKFT